MTRSSNAKGFALLAVIFVLAFLMGLAATMAVTVRMDTQLRGAFGRSLTGFYAAEAGLNDGMGTYKNIFLSFDAPSGSDFDPQTITVGDRTVTYQLSPKGSPTPVRVAQGQPFAGCNASQSTYVATSQAYKTSGDVEASVGAEFQVGDIPLFQFLAFYNGDLEIDPGAEMHLHGRIHANGDLYLGPDGHLYIEHNTNNPTVEVSCQGDVYRGRKDDGSCNSGAPVTIDKLNNTPKDLNCTSGNRRKVEASELAAWGGTITSQIRSIAVPEADNTINDRWEKATLRIVLNLRNTWAPTPNPTPGPPQFVIEVQNADGSQDTTRTTILRSFMADKTWNTTYSSMVGTWPIFYTDLPTYSGCSVTNANCPNRTPSSYNPPFGGGQASNRIYATGVTMTGYATAGPTPPTPTRTPTRNAATTGTPYPNTATPTPTPTVDADYRRGGFYNWREGTWMYLLNVNVHDLLAWNMAQPVSNRLFDPATRQDADGNDTGGIVLFLSVQNASSAGPPDGTANSPNNFGVRIFGSQTLPFPSSIGTSDPTGITIVSDQAIYVLGDYNSLSASWQPAAIIGDSLNVLSNAYWPPPPTPINTGDSVNDAQSNRSLSDSSRRALATTINAGFLSGVDETVLDGGRGTYNGGLENYPRFHEDWGGQTLNYLGAFVSLGPPNHVDGAWCGTSTPCNIYNPPWRNWDYDSRFNNPADLPPMTPHFVYLQQVFFTEDFR